MSICAVTSTQFSNLCSVAITLFFVFDFFFIGCTMPQKKSNQGEFSFLDAMEHKTAGNMSVSILLAAKY